MLYRFGWIIKCYVSLSNPPHPTAQTTYSRDMKFGMESQWGNTFWAIRGFFQFPPLSRDMGVGWGSPWGLKNLKIFFLHFFSIFELYWLNLVYTMHGKYTKKIWIILKTWRVMHFQTLERSISKTLKILTRSLKIRIS